MLRIYLTLLVFLTAFTTGTSAQETTRIRELGLRLTGTDNFGFIYKKRLDDGSYRRYRFFSGQLDFANIDGNSIANFNAGVAIGKEKRIDVADRLDFIRGPEPFLSISVQGTDDIFLAMITPGFGYVLGFQYDFSDKFYLNIETIPSVSLTYGNGDAQVVRFNAGFNSNAVAVTAAYRFLR